MNQTKTVPCVKKKAYQSVEQAREALEKMMVLGMQGYECVFCGLVHIEHRKD